MRRLFTIGGLLHVTAVLAFGQASPGQIDPTHTPVLGPHFEPELAFDATAHPELWTRETPGLHVAFGSTDAIYFRSEVPAVDGGVTLWAATGWTGERLNAMILVWS